MQLIIAMALFSLVMSITPGPVNLITLSSGMNYGLRKTLPYVLGATIGFIALLVILGMGLSEVIQQAPKLFHYLTYLGLSYMIYMGYKIIQSGRQNLKHAANNDSKVPRFVDGVILQWSNPKAWVACLSGLSAFLKGSNTFELPLFAAIYCVVCYISIGCWAILGERIARLLSESNYYSIINGFLGCSLILTALYLV